MVKAIKTYESNGPFKEMKDIEVEKLVEDCLDGKTTGIRTQDTIVSLREGTKIVDVFTIVRHRIYESDLLIVNNRRDE
jgi:hypothetical protein